MLKERLIYAFGFAEMAARSLLWLWVRSLAVHFAVSWPPCRRFGRSQTDPSSRQEPPSDQKQVAEREQREELGAVLGRTPIAGLHICLLISVEQRSSKLGKRNPITAYV